MKSAQRIILGLLRPAREEHGDVRMESLELSVVVEARALKRRHHYRRRPFLLRAKGVRGPRLVMVLDEPNEPILVILRGAQMAVYRLRGLADQTIVEALVVAEIKSLMLQDPFHVPICLRD